MLTILEDEYNIMSAIKNGADGYILKNTNPQRFWMPYNRFSRVGQP